ncbi:MAG: leucine-rich repeat domain-containing protein [Thermoguttaceae bacterium]
MADAAECKTRRRWLRLTPDRCVLGLLALEALLLLSEWFQWFPFNQHKGWTVLIAIATVGAALVLMFLWFLAALLFRLRFQFSILSLLVLMLAVAVPFSWLTVEREQARKQRAAVDWIEKAGGFVLYDYEFDPSGNPIPAAKPPGPSWLRKPLGDDYFADVTVVDLHGQEVSDAGLEHLKGLAQLRGLELCGTKVSDVGLEHLKALTQLRWLQLDGTQVSDAGLVHLKGFTQLQELFLGGTQVSDAGLENLRGLTKLQSLSLGLTQVSDAGLEHLKGLTQLQELSLGGTQVSNAGLVHLMGLTQLQTLYLGCTKVSDAGARDLQKALPNVRIMRQEGPVIAGPRRRTPAGKPGGPVTNRRKLTTGIREDTEGVPYRGARNKKGDFEYVRWNEGADRPDRRGMDRRASRA